MVDYQTIPLQPERASDRLPMKIESTGIEGFPTESFRFEFEWNSEYADGRWIVSMYHQPSEDMFSKAPASMYVPYYYRPKVCFMFYDLSYQEFKVTPENLGSQVELAAIQLEQEDAVVEE